MHLDIIVIFIHYCIAGNYTNSTKKSQIKSRWKPPPVNWIKINVNASMRQSTRPVSVRYIMRDNHASISKAKGKKIGDCPILLA